MSKRAIIDIDNTLWQFCDVFYEELKKINENFPAPEHWSHWDFWEGYCTMQEFYGAVGAIHLRQDSDDFNPYPEARGFLSALKQNGYHITIASHRSREFMTQTENWLKRHGLVYDDIDLSHDKIRLFDTFTNVVVDDSPGVLEKALESGALATGLLFPWNRDYRDKGFRLCGNLDEILEGILARVTYD
jgi:5' nucleotidase, deoxy (Pyrimidine), cytosolic type C protein (NT5C)